MPYKDGPDAGVIDASHPCGGVKSVQETKRELQRVSTARQEPVVHCLRVGYLPERLGGALGDDRRGSRKGGVKEGDVFR